MLNHENLLRRLHPQDFTLPQRQVDKLETILKKQVLSKQSENKALKKFDLNGDGKVDNEDLELFNQYQEGEVEFSEEQKEAADVNNDGKVDKKDYSLFIYAILHKAEAEDKVRDLESLYNSLSKNQKPSMVVSGVDGADIKSVKFELSQAVSNLIFIYSLMQ